MAKQTYLNRIIFILSLMGIAMAIYVLQSFLRQSPIVCISSGCEIVRKSSSSYPFGIPVPAFGLVGYSILAILAFLRTTGEKPWMIKGMLGVATLGLLFVSWFTYTELFVIRGVCMWCAISSINMLVVFLLLLNSYRMRK